MHIRKICGTIFSDLTINSIGHLSNVLLFSLRMQDQHGLKLQHWCSEVMVEPNSISVHHQNQVREIIVFLILLNKIEPSFILETDQETHI